MAFKDFLNSKFLDWQKEQGKRRTIESFAKWLKVKQPRLSMWMNGENTPKDEGVIYRIALRLGIEVYDLLDIPRPNKNRMGIDLVWEQLDDGEQERLRRDAERIAEEKHGRKIKVGSGKRKVS